ncbi:MAG: DUF302 domain-containing protein [Thiobacillus sp.]|nr:DUF302 domain-containing protein [Thiobacillus sp.]
MTLRIYLSRALAALLLTLPSLPVLAGDAILRYTANLPADTAYQKLYQALEDKGYYVIFEPNMGRTLAGMAERLGKDYNRNQLSTMRSLVFCNPMLTNRIANADPSLLALCPLHVSLTHKQGVTTVYFARPGVLAAGSPGAALVQQLESEIGQIIQGALRVQ